MNLINLDEDVLQTLNFFIENQPPKLDLSSYSLPFVVGSSNAYDTDTILFSDKPAVFGNKSNFCSLIKDYYNDYSPKVSGKSAPSPRANERPLS